jgi:WD40 repeat protein
MFPNSREVLTSGLDFHLRRWSLEEGICTHSWEAGGPLFAIEVVNSGRTALLGAVQGIVQWDLERWGLPSFNTLWSYRAIMNVAYAAATGEVLGGSEDSRIHRWRLKSQKRLAPLPGHRISVSAIDVDRQGGYALSGDIYGEIRLWDLERGLCRRAWPGHEDKITAIAMAREDTRAVTGSLDGGVRVWDLTKAQCIMNLKEDRRWVHAVALCPEGRRVVACGEGGLYLWDLERGELLDRYDRDPIIDIDISSDGSFVVGIIKSNEMILWPIG